MFDRLRIARLHALVIAAGFGMIVVPSIAQALPWDTDMLRQQSFQAGEMPRAPAQGSVPVGFQPYTLDPQQAATTLKNPTPVSLDSVWRGRRLFSANCQVCHGKLGDGESFVGPLVKAPSLIDETRKGKTDGHFFHVIRNGQGGMPRYGFKFSAAEQWDIVNYVRFLQGKDVPGIERPKK